jgi:transcriptional regulator with XRE-family HTH domain
MIQAMLVVAQESKGYSLKDITKATNIPGDTLTAYINGDHPIPLQDLLQLSHFFDIPIDALIKPVWEIDSPPQKFNKSDDWQTEFIETEKNEISVEEDPYKDMLTAFKSLPISDQAQILKILLDKLKSLSTD